MGDWFNALFPIFTLLLGAGWANFLKRGELRNAMRLDAADQLAGLPALMWAKGGDDDWINMNTAVDRLTMRLSLAGVPTWLVLEVAASAKEFWEAAYEVHGDPDVGSHAVSETANHRWKNASLAVGRYLSANNVWTRHLPDNAAASLIGKTQPKQLGGSLGGNA